MTFSDFTPKNLEKNQEKQTAIFSALSDPTRLKIIKLLGESSKPDALCVMAVAHILGISQSAVSQHLRVLKSAGLVKGERRGYRVHYFINPESFDYILKSIQEIYLSPEEKGKSNG